MYKKILLCGIVALSVPFMATGCELTKSSSQGNKEVNVGEQAFKVYNVKYLDKDVTPGKKFDYKDLDTTEKPKITTTTGCALYGMDHVYTYKDIEIVTNIDDTDKSETVYSVYFITDKVATPEGIKIGSTVDELVQALGDNYDEFNGTYTFTGQGVYITIQTKKNVVTSIEYIMITN